MSISTQPDSTEFNAAILLVGRWWTENRRQKTSEHGRRRIGGHSLGPAAVDSRLYQSNERRPADTAANWIFMATHQT